MDYVKKYYKYKAKYYLLKSQFSKSIGESSFNRVEGEEEDVRSLESEISSNSVEVSIMKKNVDEYSDDDFTSSLNRNSEYIFKINSVQLFDDFTDYYVDVIDNKLKINWEKVEDDFKGLYLVNDPKLREERYTEAFKNGKKYSSWWVNEIKDDQVVEFDRTEMTESDTENPQTPLPLTSLDSDSDVSTLDMSRSDPDQLITSSE